MKLKHILTKILHILIVSTFIFDSYYKYTYLDNEADMLRSKYQNLQDFSNTHLGFRLPIHEQTVANKKEIIIQAYAAIQVLASFFLIVGYFSSAWVLIIMSSIHTFIMHNPYYRNTTDIDRQRAYRYFYTDFCLIATLIMLMGTGRKRVQIDRM